MTAIGIWEAAASPDVDARRMPWPQLAELTRAVRALRPYESAPIVQRATQAAWAARRVLSSTPLPADHTVVGLWDLTDQLTAFLADHPAHSAADPLRVTQRALGGLLASESPVATWVADVLSEYGEAPGGRPEAVLVVPRTDLIAPVWAWLEEEGLTCADLATAAQLRRSCDHRAALVMGHPAITYSTPFAPPSVASREYGWLLTSPPAGRVRIALLDDDPPLSPADVWVWPETSAHPPWQFTVPRRTAPAAPAQVEWFARPASAPPVVRPKDAGEDAVDATAVVTASGHTVYFSALTGPTPRILGLEDTGTVTIATMPVSQLAVGRVLVEDVGGAARDELVARAAQWLVTHKGWTPARVEQTKFAAQSLKDALLWARRQLSDEELISQLTKRGLTPQYARGLMLRVGDPTYIAPHREGFDALLKVLATVPPPAGDLVGSVRAAAADLPVLRSAHQHAGELIHHDLRARLRDRDWEDELTLDGFARLHDEALGDLLITTVLGVGGSHRVPPTWLGVPHSNEEGS